MRLYPSTHGVRVRKSSDIADIADAQSRSGSLFGRRRGEYIRQRARARVFTVLSVRVFYIRHMLSAVSPKEIAVPDDLYFTEKRLRFILDNSCPNRRSTLPFQKNAFVQRSVIAGKV